MKKLNGHHIFWGISIIFGVIIGIAGNDSSLGFGSAFMVLFWGYIFYWIFVACRKSANDPLKQALREQERIYYTVVNATIIDSGTTYKTKGGLGSAVVGGALFGVPGAVVGASVGKKTTEAKTVRFLVEFKDGHKAIEDVKIDSARYKQLINFIK